MKIRTMMVAALAALTFAACSKDGGETDGGKVPEGEGAALELSINFPQSPVSRAAVTETGNAAENKVEDIYVFVFNQNGEYVSQGGFTKKNIASDFTDKGNGRYEMIGHIETLSGDRVIYVATNLPGTVTASTYANEAALQAAVNVETGLINKTGNAVSSLVMIAREEKTVIDKNVGKTILDVDMERAVAKVFGSWADDKNQVFKANWAATNDLEVKVVKYFVAQDAYKSYLAPQYNPDGRSKTLIQGLAEAQWGTVVNLYNPGDWDNSDIDPAKHIPYVSLVKDPGANERSKEAGFYIGENVSSYFDDVARWGNTPYVYIQTYYAFENGVKVNAAGTALEYTGTKIVGGAAGTGDNFTMIRIDGEGDFICADAELSDVEAFLQGENKTYNLFTYPNGIVYFKVFVNKDQGTNGGAYNVLRNQFVHMNITGFNITPGKLTGWPGDKTDPEKPIGPGEPGDPNPITPPVTPIDELPADLVVNISVLPWNYAGNSIILE